jgi:hypothetical protein
MRVLASFVMQGRGQALTVIVPLAVLALWFPPLGIVSSGVIGLIVLRRGGVDGLLLAILAAAGCAVIMLAAGAQPWVVLAVTFPPWLLILLLAQLLRFSRSLPLAAGAALLLAAGAIGASHWFEVDWSGLLEPLSRSLSESQLVGPDERKALIQELGGMMPGILGASLFLQLMLSLFLARWWQAMLYNPGGFRAEFHRFRLPKVIAVVTLAVLVLTALGGDQRASWPDHLAMLLLAGWLLQGLALTHALVGTKGVGRRWLTVIYLLLFLPITMLHAITMLAAAGLADAWFDFRARIGTGNGADAG